VWNREEDSELAPNAHDDALPIDADNVRETPLVAIASPAEDRSKTASGVLHFRQPS
jgi:hypothetical protein